VDEASFVDAVPAPAGPEDPSTGSVTEGATGVAIGEGTTVVVSGTEDPGKASRHRIQHLEIGLRDALPSAPGESVIRGRWKCRTVDWISIDTHAQIFYDYRIHNRSTHRRQKIRVPRSNDRFVRHRCCTWKFWQGTLLHRGVSRLRQICNIHSTTPNQCRINQGWRKKRDF
jgi:hypothetical protein